MRTIPWRRRFTIDALQILQVKNLLLGYIQALLARYKISARIRQRRQIWRKRKNGCQVEIYGRKDWERTTKGR